MLLELGGYLCGFLLQLILFADFIQGFHMRGTFVMCCRVRFGCLCIQYGLLYFMLFAYKLVCWMNSDSNAFVFDCLDAFVYIACLCVCVGFLWAACFCCLQFNSSFLLVSVVQSVTIILYARGLVFGCLVVACIGIYMFSVCRLGFACVVVTL